MFSRSFFILLVVVLVLIFPNSSLADCTKPLTITSRIDGNFNNKNTWEGGKVPTVCDNVIIKHKINLNQNYTIGQNGKAPSLTIEAGGSLIGASRSLNISTGALVTNNGILTVGSLVMSDYGTKKFINPGTVTVTNSVMVNTGAIVNSGSLTFNGSLDMNGSSFINTANATANIKGDINMNSSGVESSITNSGNLVITGSTTVNQGWIVNNEGANLSIGANFKMNGGDKNALTNKGSFNIAQDFGTEPNTKVENTNSMTVGGVLTNNSNFKNDRGNIVVKKSFVNSYSGIFTNNFGLVVSEGDFYNYKSIDGQYGGFQIANYSENSWNAIITGTVDINDKSLAPGKKYVDNNYGTIASTVTQSSYKPIDSLPVTITRWKASTPSNYVLLEWQTASEQNSATFVVERSLNGRDFEQIGTVKAAGNSQEVKSYTFRDETAPLGLAYYRLKQTDWDGSFTRTAVISVEVKWKSVSIKAYPNPINNSEALNLELNARSNQKIQVEILDVRGRAFYQQAVQVLEGTRIITIPAEVTSKYQGFCLIRCVDGQGQVQSIKVMLQ